MRAAKLIVNSIQFNKPQATSQSWPMCLDSIHAPSYNAQIAHLGWATRPTHHTGGVLSGCLPPASKHQLEVTDIQIQIRFLMEEMGICQV